jgi:hypothetical protein
VSVNEILALWHGDEDTFGYQHYELVVKLCDLTQPNSFEVLRRKLYPAVTVPTSGGVSTTDPFLEPETVVVLKKGWDVWRRRVEGRKEAQAA